MKCRKRHDIVHPHAATIYGSTTLPETRRIAEAWRHDYNHRRPHGSLGDITPAEAARRWDSLRSPTAPSANPSEIIFNPGLSPSLA
ncbi:MAG: transposase [Holophagaceae bacterium]|nr:transposase [Holophagaceae bacterium]